MDCSAIEEEEDQLLYRCAIPLNLVVECYVLVSDSFMFSSATPSLYTYHTILTETVKLNPRKILFNHRSSHISFVGYA
jgi:hypothetical protein